MSGNILLRRPYSHRLVSKIKNGDTSTRLVEINDVPCLVTRNFRRFNTFYKSSCCCSCGLEANTLVICRNNGQPKNMYWNLFRTSPVTGENIEMTIDHILPVSLGGTNRLSNLQTMCTKCNNIKGNKLW